MDRIAELDRRPPFTRQAAGREDILLVQRAIRAMIHSIRGKFGISSNDESVTYGSH